MAHFVLGEKRQHVVEIANIGFLEHVVGGIFDLTQIGQIACIGEFVNIDDAIVGVFFDE